MRRYCSGDFIVRYGDTVEVFLKTGEFFHSFRATSDMCEETLTRFLVFRAGMTPGTEYTFKRRAMK
ncbi:hypothetical protein pEaSNUABM56_00210 [Erwinia phage pEa_SNUABM_56]|nr:hypothetical protein pEaSNUABM55_00138 [Erwinia phage pEa_SNUABM_55]UYL85230.1 hypothetical protein pEaSNUABM56_00210 [Erwinia phage pEa_SNUABM_56]